VTRVASGKSGGTVMIDVRWNVIEFFEEHGPDFLLDEIQAPTPIVQGTVDTGPSTDRSPTAPSISTATTTACMTSRRTEAGDPRRHRQATKRAPGRPLRG
jgi:hypothetical protein